MDLPKRCVQRMPEDPGCLFGLQSWSDTSTPRASRPHFSCQSLFLQFYAFLTSSQQRQQLYPILPTFFILILIFVVDDCIYNQDRVNSLKSAYSCELLSSPLTLPSLISFPSWPFDWRPHLAPLRLDNAQLGPKYAFSRIVLPNVNLIQPP